MPHIQIDYSPNLEQRLDIAGLCRVLRDAAVATGVLPLAGHPGAGARPAPMW